MLDAIRRAAPDESVLVFGVQIVDVDGVRRRQQTFRRERYLEPREALRRLLRNSSFVRQPTRRRAPRGHRARGPVRHHRRRRHRHRPVGAAVLPLRRAVPAPGDLCVHHSRGGGDDRHVAPRHDPGRPQNLRPCDRAGACARAHHPALAGRLPPPVHPRRRLPPATDGAAGRGPRGAAAVRAAGGPRPGVSPKWLPVRAAFTAATGRAGRATRRVLGTERRDDLLHDARPGPPQVCRPHDPAVGRPATAAGSSTRIARASGPEPRPPRSTHRRSPR